MDTLRGVFPQPSECETHKLQSYYFNPAFYIFYLKFFRRNSTKTKFSSGKCNENKKST